MKYKHAEAFCLMTYLSFDGTEEEIIWNSRDGVAPFVISLKSGKYASHVNWSGDVRVQDHKPKPGDRIFVDLTWARALELAEENLKRWNEVNEVYELNFDELQTEPQTVIELADAYMSHRGAPDIIEVQ